MKQLPNKYSLLQYYQILSLDVVLGTISIGAMAIKILNITANPYWWVVLPFSVWIVYTLDHVVDSYKNGKDAVIDRHRFHYHYRNQILSILFIVTLITLSLTFLFMEKRVIYYGLILTLITGVYLLIVFRLKRKKSILLQKEFIIAIIYTSGIFLAPLVWYGNIPSYPAMLVIFNIFMLAWLEGIMAGWFDYPKDIKDGHTSFTVITGVENTQRIIITTHIILILLTLISMFFIKNSTALIALSINVLMNIILLLIVTFPNKFQKNNYYKIVGEAVFVLPILTVLI